MNKNELENRLIRFAINNNTLTSQLIPSEFSRILTGQLIRSSISPALNYGEACAAESQRDFIHKLRICLKELRESHVTLKMIQLSETCRNEDLIQKSTRECNELISIFVASIRTAQIKSELRHK